eukprot:TRINITY_DN788_c0_g1_i1.p1 TRINITY_DN788_c0_g1~~TRINITY_DN788_c0_g1_i1.p1  ORF type:complete len:228 (+),score=37.73 TRINITY_DN788_c0_g1_i1:97-684(+)
MTAPLSIISLGLSDKPSHHFPQYPSFDDAFSMTEEDDEEVDEDEEVEESGVKGFSKTSLKSGRSFGLPKVASVQEVVTPRPLTASNRRNRSRKCSLTDSHGKENELCGCPSPELPRSLKQSVASRWNSLKPKRQSRHNQSRNWFGWSPQHLVGSPSAVLKTEESISYVEWVGVGVAALSLSFLYSRSDATSYDYA